MADKKECNCVYATSDNTPSVRKGHEVGGYLKQECPACAARRAAPPLADDDLPPERIEQLWDEAGRACESRLASIVEWRKELLEGAITGKMKDTNLFGSAKYATREQALATLEAEKDFFGNYVSRIKYYGSVDESAVKALRAMCKFAGVIRLSTEDVALIARHLN